MRILFIYANIDCPLGVSHGLAALSAVLKRAGHQTALVHVSRELGPIPSNAEIIERIRSYAPGLIGFSAMSQQYEWTCALARDIRAAGIRVPLSIGGVHATMVPEEVARTGLFDYVGVGEAEYALLELVERLERGRDTSSVPNFWVLRGDGGPIRNPVGPFTDLDSLPELDWDLFDMGKILEAKRGWLSVLTSRGCPYHCSYCFNHQIVERYVGDGAASGVKEYLRRYPVDRVLNDIRRLKKRYPVINTIIFDDDLFTLDRRYVITFCNRYRESGIGLPFVVNAHVQVFGDDIARALQLAGCKIVKFGLESGSERVRREILFRRMTNETIERAVYAAHRRGLHTSGFIMFGLPTETREEVLETLRLCARTEIGRFRWALFFPFPGTAGYGLAKDLGLIDFEKMKRLGNYFDGTCLVFGEEHDLWLEKVAKVCNWWVNAFSNSPAAPLYRRLVAEIEGLDRDAWEDRKAGILSEDAAISEELLEKRIPHYSIRYSPVMGVHSDFLLRERERRERREAPEGPEYVVD